MKQSNTQQNTIRITITIPSHLNQYLSTVTTNKSAYISQLLQSNLIKEAVTPSDPLAFLQTISKKHKKITNLRLEKMLLASKKGLL